MTHFCLPEVYTVHMCWWTCFLNNIKKKNLQSAKHFIFVLALRKARLKDRDRLFFFSLAGIKHYNSSANTLCTEYCTHSRGKESTQTKKGKAARVCFHLSPWRKKDDCWPSEFCPTNINSLQQMCLHKLQKMTVLPPPAPLKKQPTIAGISRHPQRTKFLVSGLLCSLLILCISLSAWDKNLISTIRDTRV